MFSRSHIASWLVVAGGLFVSCVIVSCIDVVILRDPFIAIGDGYVIQADSGGSPAHLYYIAQEDRRRYSEWYAVRISIAGMPTFALYNSTTKELRELESESELCVKGGDLNARPKFADAVAVRGVRTFSAKGGYVTGQSENGWYILDVAANCPSLYVDYHAALSMMRRLGIPEGGQTTITRLRYTRPPGLVVLYCAAIVFGPIGGLVWLRGANGPCDTR